MVVSVLEVKENKWQKKKTEKPKKTDLEEFVRKLKNLEDEYNVYFLAGDEWSDVFVVDRDTNERCRIG